MTPDFKILVAGINITPQIKDRLLSLTITDEAGFKSDAVEIRLDDRDGIIELPLPGALLAVLLGYKETFLMPMGLFTSDEIAIKSPPQTLTIRGKAANMGGTIKEQKTRDWDNKTIKQIVEKIAGEHKLKAKVAKDHADFKYEHLDQTDESDIHFLTRIGKEHDAIVSVKSGTLLFMGKGEGKTASGLAMIPRPITKSGDISYAATLANRGNFKSIEAFWHDQKTGKKEKVIAGKGSPIKRIRHTYTNKVEATKAAKAKLDEVSRGNDTLSIAMPGDPLIAAEMRILVIGFRIGVDGLWSVKSVTHTITASGFMTKISAEKPKEKKTPKQS